jgi:ubiquinone/menaquinone biosynthesis C-methylase UbiE
MASQTQTVKTSPYDGLAARYDRSRPSYPPESIAHLRAEAGDLVADVGAGTGIFTRQLAGVLREAHVIGVEASEDMHREAERSSRGIANLSFLQGKAEALPFDDKTVRMITVATAIHWFDRPAFYTEVMRCLRHDGELLVLQNIRRWWQDAFLADYETLHESAVEGYRRNRYPSRSGGYEEIDVEGELRARPDFCEVKANDFAWSRAMSSDEFVDFSLSSSITQRAVAAMGDGAYLRALRQILEQHADSAGMVEIPYVTRVTSARPLVPGDH